MIRKHISLLVLQMFLLFQIAATDADICSSNFETKKSQLCSQLSTSEKVCYFFNDECRDWFKECSDYSPGSNFDENICQKITPSNNLKKCQVQTTSGTKTCIEVDKACEDFTDNTCFNLNLGSDKRCVLLSGKCEEHYNSCEGLPKEKCSNNIPSINSQRCVWTDSTSTCSSQERQCQDFIEYTENGKKNLACDSLKSTSPKICLMNGNNCDEVYKTCGEAKDKTTCENTIPVQCFGGCGFSPSLKCVWEGETCVETPRICSDYKKREGDQFDFCGLFKSEKTEHRDYKKCSINYSTDTCEEKYKTCDSYNNVISKEERIEADCVAIDPGQTSMNINKGSKCIFDKEKKECKEVYQNCEDQTSRESCIRYKLEDTNKYCFPDGDLCIEQYKSCEAYDEEIEEANRKKEDCESILPSYTDGDYKCIFTESKTCTKKKLETCEDYEGINEDFCNKITLAESSTYRCMIKDNKCITEFKDCYAYGRQKDQTKERCESIILSASTKKCLFSLNTCAEYSKKCVEFAGSSDEECGTHQTSNSSVVCVHENNKCVEKTNYAYKYCYEYGGKDKKICEAIIPWNSWSNQFLLGKKCVLNSYGCAEVNKECSEAKNEKECYSITPADSSKKHCVFIDNECKEQYKACVTYENSESTLNKETCESIVIKDDNTNKCVFTEGKDGAKGTCRMEAKKCSDFNIGALAKECSDLSSSLPIDTKKCSFSDKTCKTVDKTSCSELSLSIDATEENCKIATTSSSNLKCVYKSGCKEVNSFEETNNEKDKDNNTSDSTKDNNSSDNSKDGNASDNKKSETDNNGNQGNGNNYARNNYLNKLLLILLWVFV